MGSSQATWEDMERGYPHCIRHCNAHPMCEGCRRYNTPEARKEQDRREAERIGSLERG